MLKTMRIVLQRVSKANVVVDAKITGQIGQGLVLLIGIAENDDDAILRWMAEKCVNLRIFEDEAGKMNRSLLEVNGAILAISQFTLYGDCRKGRRPSFIAAARPEIAAPTYERFVGFLREFGIMVETGIFGAHMALEIHNDGPVTLILDRDN